MTLVRRFRPTEWHKYRELRLAALRESPDAFGSTYAREARRPDSEWSRRLTVADGSGRDLPLVAERGTRGVGLAWGRIDTSEGEVCHVYQMWVSPEARGDGVGGMLLDELISWARAGGATAVVLSVTCGNQAAEGLYASRGFRPAGEPQPLRPDSPLLSQILRLAL